MNFAKVLSQMSYADLCALHGHLFNANSYAHQAWKALNGKVDYASNPYTALCNTIHEHTELVYDAITLHSDHTPAVKA